LLRLRKLKNCKKKYNGSNNTDPEVLENLPKAIEIAKQKKQTRIKKNIIDSIPKNYGGLNPSRTIISFRTEWKDLFPR